MRHFKLKIFLLLISLVVVTAGATVVFVYDRISLGILISLLIPIIIIIHHNLIGRLICIMSSFVRGLEMNDVSMRFEADSNDTELFEMAQSMNRISSLYVKNKRELETRKLYYDRILRVMTHEMRNAIAPIVSLSADMYDNPDSYGKPEISEAVEIIKSQSEGIKRFLDSYHELTHLPAPEQEHVNATVFFNKISKTIACIEYSLFPNAGVVDYNIGSDITLNIDENLISQVLTNLIKNSLEAVKEKYISICNNNDNTCTSVYSPVVNVFVIRNAESVLITIEDNGYGLPREIAENPFQPFVTTKSNGSGIGLFLSRQIIRLHSGDIRLHNNPGKGLSIHITLPAQ